MRTKILYALFSLSILVGLPVVILGIYATNEWNDYVGLIRRNGQPLTFAEVEAARRKLPDDQNSALLIERMAADLDTLESRFDEIIICSDEYCDSFFEGFHKKTIENGKELFAENEDLIIELGRLEKFDQGYFQLDYSLTPMETSINIYVESIRNAARLLWLDHKIKRIVGDVKSSFSNVSLLFRLAGTLREDPRLVSRLSQIGTEALAIEGIEDLLKAGRLEEKQIQELVREVEKCEKSGTMKWALLGERAMFLAMCDDLIEGRVPRGFNPAIGRQELAPGWLRLPACVGRPNQRHGVQMLTSLIDHCENPPELIRAAEQMDEELASLSSAYFLAKLLLPRLSASATLNARILALHRCTIAALQAERFRLARGRLPRSFEELTPEYLAKVPLDPFDEKPLRLKQTESGIVIYSVDKNRVDDEGIVHVARQHEGARPPDVGFRLHDFAHRGVRILDDPPSDRN